MTVCLFGNYLRDSARTQVITKGLLTHGVRIVACHSRTRGWRKFVELYQQHKAQKNKYDVLLVGPGGQALVWFAKLLTKKPIVLDAFVSHYLTETEDRKKAKPESLRARRLFKIDQRGCQRADLVLLDTNAQINYFVETFKLPRDKFKRLFVGADNEIFYPAKTYNPSRPPSGGKSSPFLVHWHGHIVPFHGVETIIQAANLLKDEPTIKFQIITRFNSKFEKLNKLVKERHLTNISFIEEVPRSKLAELINQAHVCLGIFGDNQKAQVVIPNKIYEALACAKPSITARHKVLSELFTDGKNILTVASSDPQELADKILELKKNQPRRDGIGRSAYELYQAQLTPAKIGQELYTIVKTLL